MESISRKSFMISIHIGFLLVGVITVLLGQILPVLSNRLTLNDRDAGYLFIAQFAGSLTGVFLYNPSINKLGYLKTLIWGFCLMSAGCLSLNFDSFYTCLFAVYIYGIGIGSTIPTVNMLTVELNRQNSAASLNTVNFFWGVGAILAKPFVDLVGSNDSFLFPTVFLSVFLLIIGIVIGTSKITVNSERPEPEDGNSGRIWQSPTAWLIAFFNFVNIGIESSVGGWITTFQERIGDKSPFVWLSAAFIFFLLMVVGRGFAPLILRKTTENLLLFGNITLLIIGAILILLAQDFWLLICGAGVIGFGTSSIFPTNMARFTKIFGAKSTTNATPIFVLGTLGGAFMTWLVGFLSTYYENLRIGFIAILTSCLILMVLQTILSQKRTHIEEKEL